MKTFGKIEIFAVIFVLTLGAFYLFFNDGGGLVNAAKEIDNPQQIVKAAIERGDENWTGQEIRAFYKKREQTLQIDEEVKTRKEVEVLNDSTKTSTELFSGKTDLLLGEGVVTRTPSSLFLRKKDDPLNKIMSHTVVLLDGGTKVMVRVANIDKISVGQRVKVFQGEKFKHAQP